MSKIKSGSKIKDVISEHPEVKDVLKRHGMMCVNCKGFSAETLRNAANNHGVPLARLIDEIEGAITKG